MMPKSDIACPNCSYGDPEWAGQWPDGRSYWHCPRCNHRWNFEGTVDRVERERWLARHKRIHDSVTKSAEAWFEERHPGSKRCPFDGSELQWIGEDDYSRSGWQCMSCGTQFPENYGEFTATSPRVIKNLKITESSLTPDGAEIGGYNVLQQMADSAKVADREDDIDDLYDRLHQNYNPASYEKAVKLVNSTLDLARRSGLKKDAEVEWMNLLFDPMFAPILALSYEQYERWKLEHEVIMEMVSIEVALAHLGAMLTGQEDRELVIYMDLPSFGEMPSGINTSVWHFRPDGWWRSGKRMLFVEEDLTYVEMVLNDDLDPFLRDRFAPARIYIIKKRQP